MRSLVHGAEQRVERERAREGHVGHVSAFPSAHRHHGDRIGCSSQWNAMDVSTATLGVCEKARTVLD